MASISDSHLVHWIVFCHLFHKLYFSRYVIIVMHRIMTFRSTTDRIYDVGPIRLLLLLLLLLVVVVVVVVAVVLVLVFSPWASLGTNQSPVRRPVWLWYAASWASS